MAGTTSSLDLSLPSHAPELLKDYCQTCTFEQGSFAIYTLVPGMSPARVDEIAAIPQANWEDIELETQLVQPAKPTPLFAGRPLFDVLQAHAAMDIEVQPSEHGGASDVGWQPHCFVVITNDNLNDHGLLFVYADTAPDGEGRVAAVDKFFFKPEDMYVLLSGVVLGSHGFPTLKKFYAVD
ncbi:hypothetical protein MPH_03989 [Macrophomina phaseolina MS6]|uniref:Uncharacterized protein n=2 Tax=Macrophomina phaseolina TaxID=35725 RepID=K2RVD3_MACPH|nr:hypothetical protein MPH_03989 [Macrophomina phaseolina MS6]KAH7030075.1 hypothetical protein B0J12DRAFT_682619 [Macrophomina phaseolina]